jgi:hypothetical protein
MRRYIARNTRICVDQPSPAQVFVGFVHCYGLDDGAEEFVLVVEFVGEVHGGDAGADADDAELAGGRAHWFAVEGDPFWRERVVVAAGWVGGWAVGGVWVAV